MSEASRWWSDVPDRGSDRVALSRAAVGNGLAVEVRLLLKRKPVLRAF
jgi:hypothetical protein